MVPECQPNGAGKHTGPLSQEHFVYLGIFTHGTWLSSAGGLRFRSAGALTGCFPRAWTQRKTWNGSLDKLLGSRLADEGHPVSLCACCWPLTFCPHTCKEGGGSGACAGCGARLQSRATPLQGKHSFSLQAKGASDNTEATA